MDKFIEMTDAKDELLAVPTEMPVGGPGFCSISPALKRSIKIQATVTFFHLLEGFFLSKLEMVLRPSQQFYVYAKPVS